MYRSIARFAFALLAAVAVTGGAHAQSWPTKPVRVIVPFTAGSATDILARTFGQKLQELWGQSVVVENRPGAGGTIGAGVVAHAAPDGYILLVHSAGYAVNPWIYPGLPYDTARDFTEIAPLGGQPNVLVVSPESGINSVADLIARA
jgi:tripartite-type tricarboxylate transporter receptor subunit TctC